MNRADLIKLHQDMNTFHDFMARREIPPNYESEECLAIAEVLEIIEKVTNETNI